MTEFATNVLGGRHRSSRRSLGTASRLGRAALIAWIAAALTPVVGDGPIPSTLASGPTEILVTNASDVTNGAVERVADLRARPGPDGISLREAIEATNFDPGVYAIRFDSALAGTVILLQEHLPALTGGGVDLGGDIDGDGRPDVTIRSDADIGTGLHVASSGNRIAGLTIEGFVLGAEIGPPPGPLVAGQTFADNTLSGLVIRDVSKGGINVSVTSADCTPPCASADLWLNTTISGNSIEAESGGILFFVSGDGDRVEGATIADNRIRISGPRLGAGINAETGGDSTGAQISDVLISGNVIEGSPDIGIQVGAGGNRAQEGVLEHVQILDNRVVLEEPDDESWSVGITVEAGSDTAEFAIGPPVRYLDDNTVRDVVIRGNSIEGRTPRAIEVQAGQNGGSRNRIVDLLIEANVVRTTWAGLGSGTLIFIGETPSYNDRSAEGNEVSSVIIRDNEFTIEGAPDANVCDETTLASAIALVGGGESGRGNAIRDVAIDGNVIEIAHLGIAVIGGIWPTAQDNVVDDIRIGANRITGAAEPVFVSSNCLGASGNLASVTVSATPSPVARAEPRPAPSASSQSSGPTTSPLGWAVAVGALAIIATLTALLLLAVRRQRARDR